MPPCAPVGSMGCTDRTDTPETVTTVSHSAVAPAARILAPSRRRVARRPGTTASRSRQKLSSDTTMSSALCLHVPQLGPRGVLTGQTLLRPSLQRHTQPLHRPRASSHLPATRCLRPYRHSSAQRPSDAAAIALAPPRPTERSVLPPRRAPGSTASWSGRCAFVRGTFLCHAGWCSRAATGRYGRGQVSTASSRSDETTFDCARTPAESARPSRGRSCWCSSLSQQRPPTRCS